MELKLERTHFDVPKTTERGSVEDRVTSRRKPPRQLSKARHLTTRTRRDRTTPGRDDAQRHTSLLLGINLACSYQVSDQAERDSGCRF